MDSSQVNKNIKKVIKPYLFNNGFIKNSARSFWKHNKENICVINFHSFNSYNAGVMNVTTFSFAINLGVFWNDLPNYENIKVKDNFLLPLDYDCQFRHALTKNDDQSETDLKTVWYLDEKGKNLNDVLNDALTSIEKAVPFWFNKLTDKHECLQLLLNANENMEGTFGFGNKNSPIRNLLTGYFAYWTNDNKLANQSFQNALDSNCFPNWQKNIQEIIKLTGK
jgi:hypothetical protein